MIENSSFTVEEVKDTIKLNYDICVDNLEIINKGNASIFKIYSNEKKYIFKEYQSKYKKEDILREINAINYLKQKTNIPLPTILRANDGNYYFENKNRTIILQEYIEGYEVEKNEGNYEQIIESAKYLGQIIKGFENFNVDKKIKISDWYSKAEFEKANRKYNEIIEKIDDSEIGQKIKEDIIFKQKIMKKLSQNIDINELNKITHKVSHGDYSCLQFIYDKKQNVKAIIDFIKVQELPVIWEIARSYSYIDKKAKDGKIDVNNLVNYTREVDKIINLNEYDFKYLPYVYLIQLARSAFGYTEYLKNTANKDEILKFAFYRTNICRELDERADEISRELLKYKGK